MPLEQLQIAHPLGEQEPSVSLTLFILLVFYYENPSAFFFLSHSNDSLYGRRRIKGILTHSFLGILLQKTFWSLLSSHFLVIDWLYKETKLVETPSIVRTLRGLLLNMQNFSLPKLGPWADTANLLSFFRVLLSAFSPAPASLFTFLAPFSLCWDFNIDGKRVWVSFKDHRIKQEGSLGGDWNKNPSNRWYVARIFQIWSAPASYGELAEPKFWINNTTESTVSVSVSGCLVGMCAEYSNF